MTGRRRKGKTVLLRTYIPEHIYMKLQQHCADPTSKDKVYGLQSQLITHLLVDFFAKKEKPDDLDRLLGPYSVSKPLQGTDSEM